MQLKDQFWLLYMLLHTFQSWKAVLQLWHQRCSCGSNCESCYGVGYVQFPPTVKAEGVTYMVLIGD